MRLALVLWGVLWALIGAPWRSFRPSPSLRRLALVPFSDGSLRSNVLNVIAFVPLGFLGSRLGWSPRTAALAAAGTSLLTELLQLFSSRRHPSVTDLILNIGGALIGIAIARSLQIPPAGSARALRQRPQHRRGWPLAHP